MQPQKAKSNAQFSIEMDFKGMVVFLILVSLTGATLFYLGMIFGKASRSPNEDMRPAASSEALPGGTTPKDLQIYDLGNNNQNVNNLRQEFESLKNNAEPAMESEAEALQREAAEARQLKQAAQQTGPTPATPAPAPKTPAEAAATAPSPAEAPGISWPDVARETRGETGPLYTIQIFTTRDQNKAERMVGQLKQKGFAAYSEEIRLEGTLLYRVRVAKEPKENIEPIKNRLNKVVSGLGRLAVIQVQ